VALQRRGRSWHGPVLHCGSSALPAASPVAVVRDDVQQRQRVLAGGAPARPRGRGGRATEPPGHSSVQAGCVHSSLAKQRVGRARAVGVQRLVARAPVVQLPGLGRPPAAHQAACQPALVAGLGPAPPGQATRSLLQHPPRTVGTAALHPAHLSASLLTAISCSAASACLPTAASARP
jgi:hypothetical protein